MGVEGVVDGGVSGEEALSRFSGFKPLLFSLSSPYWEMRVFRSIVISQSAWPMKVQQAQLIQSGGIRSQAVCRNALGHNRLGPQQAREQPKRGSRIPLLLHNHVEDDTLIIDCAPQKPVFACNRANHLIYGRSRRP